MDLSIFLLFVSSVIFIINIMKEKIAPALIFFKDKVINLC